MVDAPPRDIRDVQQTVDAAEIDEGAVVGDVLDHAFQDLSFLKVRDKLAALFLSAFLEDGAARDHDVAAAAVHLEDLERLRRTEQRRDVADGTDVDLAARQERHGARKVDGETALDPAEDRAGHLLIGLEALLQQRPGFFAARLLARQDGLAVAIFHSFEIHIDDVADADLFASVVTVEFSEGHPPFRFQARVDYREIIFNGYDVTLDHRSFETVLAAKGLVQKIGETFFLHYVSSHIFRTSFRTFDLFRPTG